MFGSKNYKPAGEDWANGTTMVPRRRAVRTLLAGAHAAPRRIVTMRHVLIFCHRLERHLPLIDSVATLRNG